MNNSSNSNSGSIAEVDMEDVDSTASDSIGQHHQRQQMQCHHTNNRLWGAVEIIPNRLYYSPLHFFPPNNDNDNDNDDDDDDSLEELETTSSSTTMTNNRNINSTSPQRQDTNIHYFTIDDKLLYWNFFLDFGPYNLGQLYRYAQTLTDKLTDLTLKQSIICYYSGVEMSNKANAVFLICAYQILVLGRTLDESYFGFQESKEEDDVDLNVNDVGGGGVGKSGDSSSMRMTRNNSSRNTSLPPRTTKMPTTAASMMTTRRGKKEKETENKYNTSLLSSTSSSFTRRPWQQHQPQQQQSPFAPIHPLPSYHDASPVQCTYELTVYDCLAGLVKARQFHFFNFGTNNPTTTSTALSAVTPSSTAATATTTTSLFDIDEYEFFEQVENGDLNWIISNKILAFAGPRSQRVTTSDGYCVLTPSDYIPHFTRWGVKLVIQLNAGGYDPTQFTNTGSIHHVKHVYPDGSCPELHTLQAVLADMENAILTNNSAIAVHCKAGLGRTGTCIGAYIMKHYHFTAKEVIGYMRICRPGMVIGPQQHYLSDIQNLMWQEGDVYHGRGIKDGAALPLLIGGRKEDDDNNNNNNNNDKDVMMTKSTMLAMASPSSSSSGTSPTLSIVTPDGRPFRLSTTPVNSARTLNMDTTPSPTTTTASSSSASPTSSSKTSMSLDDDDNYHTRGDQAETLLSRRLDQYQARTTRQQQQQKQQQQK
jgi:cell division cycle 14